MAKKNKLNFTYLVIKRGKTIEKCQAHSKRIFYNKIRSINWKKSIEKVYLRVNYGKRKCIQGCLCAFYNEGEYNIRKDLLFALSAFTEDGL